MNKPLIDKSELRKLKIENAKIKTCEDCKYIHRINKSGEFFYACNYNYKCNLNDKRCHNFKQIWE